MIVSYNYTKIIFLISHIQSQENVKTTGQYVFKWPLLLTLRVLTFFVPYLLLIYLTIGYEGVKRPLMQRL